MVSKMALYLGQIEAIMLGSQPASTAARTVFSEQLSARTLEPVPDRSSRIGSRKTNLNWNISQLR
ncbi:MAG: hypothetical protein CL923_00555 [Deltaproteobacteria bacterium]|nr:hypothetical protein [Deltaproteobacteria bacterium]